MILFDDCDAKRWIDHTTQLQSEENAPDWVKPGGRLGDSSLAEESIKLAGEIIDQEFETNKGIELKNRYENLSPAEWNYLFLSLLVKECKKYMQNSFKQLAETVAQKLNQSYVDKRDFITEAHLDVERYVEGLKIFDYIDDKYKKNEKVGDYASWLDRRISRNNLCEADNNLENLETGEDVEGCGYTRSGKNHDVTVVHTYEIPSTRTMLHAEIPIDQGIDYQKIKEELKLGSLEEMNKPDKFSLVVQRLKLQRTNVGLGYAPAQISLKPQWNFSNDEKAAWVQSMVKCKVSVIDSPTKKSLLDFNTETAVIFHANLVSCDTHHLGFDGQDDKSRAILYNVEFNKGTPGSHAEKLNGKSKTGLILLYNDQDLEKWKGIAVKGRKMIDVLKDAPLVDKNELLQKILGLKKK